MNTISNLIEETKKMTLKEDKYKRFKTEENISKIIYIQKKFRDKIIRKQYIRIFEIFKLYKNKFKQGTKTKRITEYEIAIGFTEDTRVGSKTFNMQFGYFMENIYDVSLYFTKFKQDGNNGGNDGVSNIAYFEAKNRHDTMKQSQAISEITPKLKEAIKKNKNFILFILIDKNFIDRDIPLHKGNSLNNISCVDGYDMNKHRWISGINVYKYLFPNNFIEIKNYILHLLSSLK